MDFFKSLKWKYIIGGIDIKIDIEKCVSCLNCIPYCPVIAIKKRFDSVIIDQEKCVECGVCLRSGVCSEDAFYVPETFWPRTIRAMWSGGGYPQGMGFQNIKNKEKIPRLSFTEVKEGLVGGGSRGTHEMKTNDITGRYREEDVGIGVELGRPGVGFYFSDLEKASIKLAKIGVYFEPDNPVTELLDIKTGEIKEEYKEIRGERALSAIIECRAPKEKTVEIYNGLREVSEEIDTVFSLDIISKCKDGEIIVKNILDNEGIPVRINGKVNIGLGRPLIP